MGNDLVKLQPVLYSAAQEVSAEPVGVVDSINMSFDDKGVAKGDKVKVPYAPSASASDFTPAATTTTGSDAKAENVDVEITASKKVSFHLTGEQIRSLENGENYQEWTRQMIAQGMRTLRNLAEVDASIAVKQGASRAIGTAATTPFATDINIIAELLKAMKDNGAPLADLNLVLNTSAGFNLRKLGIIQQAHLAGTDAERRQGTFLRQFGFQIKESAGVGLHTAGTGENYLTNLLAGYPVGTKTLAVDTGVGTVLAGDVVTFAADSVNKYVVNSALAGGNLTLNRPGLRVAVADNNAMTVGAAYTANLAFERSAVIGVMRPPIMPANPTITQIPISDKFGLTYLLLDIAQYGQRTWELHLAWGFKVVQSEHVMLLLG